MTAYFTQAELEQFTGMVYTDFKQAGTTMTAEQWASFISTVIEPWAGQIVHRYCGVLDFHEHEVEDYFNGRGASDDDNEYIENDRCFYPREQPVIDIEEVSENTASISDVPSWTTRTEQSDTVAGDFQTIEDEFYQLTHIRFFTNVPKLGYQNVYIKYNAGFVDESTELAELKGIALQLAQNLLLAKKKVQEGQTIRKFGVKDFSQIFDIVGVDEDVLTPEIAKALDRYKRYNVGGRMWQ